MCVVLHLLYLPRVKRAYSVNYPSCVIRNVTGCSRHLYEKGARTKTYCVLQVELLVREGVNQLGTLLSFRARLRKHGRGCRMTYLLPDQRTLSIFDSRDGERKKKIFKKLNAKQRLASHAGFGCRDPWNIVNKGSVIFFCTRVVFGWQSCCCQP